MAQIFAKEGAGILQKKCAYYPHRIGERVCEGLFEKGFCLPSGTAMTEEDIDRVVEMIRKVRSRKSEDGSQPPTQSYVVPRRTKEK